MVYMLACACVLAMGPLLEIAGYRLLPLPAAALAIVPIIDKAMPARFMMYAYLAAAVIVAMWLTKITGKKAALGARSSDHPLHAAELVNVVLDNSG